MKLFSGDATLKGNLDVLSDKPLDSRLVVLNKNELYTLDPRYAYVGMPVSCIAEQAIYMLIDKTKINLPEGWKKGAGSDDTGNQSQLGPNLIFMEESEYKALLQYDADTLYFIYEPWVFGDKFPVVLK